MLVAPLPAPADDRPVLPPGTLSRAMAVTLEPWAIEGVTRVAVLAGAEELPERLVGLVQAAEAPKPALSMATEASLAHGLAELPPAPAGA